MPSVHISSSGKPAKTLPERYALIRFIEKDSRRFVLRDGREILEVGTGKAFKDLTVRRFILLIRAAIQAAKQQKLKTVALEFDPATFKTLKLTEAELSSLLAQNIVMAAYEFTKFKTKNGSKLEEVCILNASKTVAEGLKKGATIGEAVNACRDLANTPGGDMTPHKLAEETKKALRGTKARVTVLDVPKMKKLGMGAILGVGKGSGEPPRFIVIEYWGKGKGKGAPVVLAGKGITFDSGGLNVKTGDSMGEMHMDMSGGAAVIHALAYTAKQKLKVNVIGLIPAAENMPSGSSYRPGDVLTSLSGKTIEVLNTDAEGRVVLADALTYAKRYKPSLLVEASTLTGAVLIALGQQASAILSRHQPSVDLLIKLGEETGDYLWPLPMWEEYDEMVRGNFGDVANIPASGNSRYAGVIGGGLFLEQFADGYPFVHLDIASRMTPAPNESLAKGATGVPVRLFIRLLEHLARA